MKSKELKFEKIKKRKKKKAKAVARRRLRERIVSLKEEKEECKGQVLNTHTHTHTEIVSARLQLYGHVGDLVVQHINKVLDFLIFLLCKSNP